MRLKLSKFIQDKDILSIYLLLAMQAISQIIITRELLKVLGAYEFGLLIMAISTINFTSIGLGWLTGGIARKYFGKEKINHHEITQDYKIYSIIYWAYGVLSGLFSTILILYKSKNEANEILTTLVVVVLYGASYFRFSNERILYSINNKQYVINIIEIVGLFFYLTAIICGIINLKEWLNIVITLALILIMQAEASKFYLKKEKIISKTKINLKEIISGLKKYKNRESLTIQIFGVLALISCSEGMLLGYLFNPELAATFIILWRIPEYANLVLAKWISVVAPKIIINNNCGKKKLRESFYKSQHIIIIYSFIFAIIYAVWGEEILKHWINSSLIIPRTTLLLASVSIFLSMLTKLFINLKYISGKLGVINLLILTEIVLKFTLALTFDYQHSIEGLFLGSIIGNSILLYYSFRVMK